MSKLRKSAKGQGCTVNIVGVCNYDKDTVVLAHLPSTDNGIGRKSSDWSACFACSACHDAMDGRTKCDEYRDNEHFYARRAQHRTIAEWVEQGLVKVV